MYTRIPRKDVLWLSRTTSIRGEVSSIPNMLRSVRLCNINLFVLRLSWPRNTSVIEVVTQQMKFSVQFLGKLIGQISTDSTMVNDTTNSTFNTSNEVDFLPASQCVPWIAVLAIECLAIVILNVISFIVFATQRELQRQGTFLPIRNLAIVDLLAGAISGPLQIERLGEHCDLWEYDWTRSWVNDLKFALLHLFSMASLANLVAISLERMYATLRPFQHLVARKRIYVIIIAAIWLTAVIREILQIVFNKDAKLAILVNSTLYLPYYYISLFIICLSYVSIFMRVRCSVHPNSQNSSANNRERRLTITLFIVTVASLVTLLPVITFLTAKVTSESFSNSKRVYFHVRVTVVMFFLANSLANPIIYSLRMQAFRQSLKALFVKSARNETTTIFQLRSLTRRT